MIRTAGAAVVDAVGVGGGALGVGGAAVGTAVAVRVAVAVTTTVAVLEAVGRAVGVAVGAGSQALIASEIGSCDGATPTRPVDRGQVETLSRRTVPVPRNCSAPMSIFTVSR